MGLIPIVTYACILVFVAAVCFRFIKLARMPIHLRWELYPVAHEKGRVAYGGSYLEEPDWWTKPRHSSLMGELAVMIPEILLLEGVRENNRSHWLRTFPFHMGLYLLAGLIVLLIAGGIAAASGAAVSAQAPWAGALLYHLTVVVGYAGLGLGLLGALFLLARRTFNPDYREYTKSSDYFNLYFFAGTLGLALVAQIGADPDFSLLRDYFRGIVTFDLQAASFTGAAGWIGLEIVLASILVAYIPLTHMAHFFTKYFMYHDIRWSDAPNLRGGSIERKVGEVLKYPVSWSAPHIRGDGKKNWVDVATSDVEENGDKKDKGAASSKVEEKKG